MRDSLAERNRRQSLPQSLGQVKHARPFKTSRSHEPPEVHTHTSAFMETLVSQISRLEEEPAMPHAPLIVGMRLRHSAQEPDPQTLVDLHRACQGEADGLGPAVRLDHRGARGMPNASRGEQMLYSAIHERVIGYDRGRLEAKLIGLHRPFPARDCARPGVARCRTGEDAPVRR